MLIIPLKNKSKTLEKKESENRGRKGVNMNQHDRNLIELIIEASNSSFFSRLAKLLRMPYPATLEEKRSLLRKVKGRWDGEK